MCTDYTDLNKACLKDSYPLPSIDRLVDGASGQEMMTFLDAYSEYNQIKMHDQISLKQLLQLTRLTIVTKLCLLA